MRIKDLLARLVHYDPEMEVVVVNEETGRLEEACLVQVCNTNLVPDTGEEQEGPFLVINWVPDWVPDETR